MRDVKSSTQKKISYNGNTNLKGTNTHISWSKEMIEDYVRCMNDVFFFAEKYFKIVSLDRGLINIPLYDWQKDILQSYVDNRFNCLMASRQVGKSVITTVFLLHYVLFNDHKTVAILANKADSAREILSRIQLAYENLPHWLQQGVVEWNKGSCVFENGSKIIAASTASSAIRGKSISVLYLDEYAFVPNNIAEEFMRSVYPTITSGSQTKIIVSSTPKGMNHFYKMVEDAKQKRNEYTLKVVYWHQIPGRDEEWKRKTINNIGVEAFSQEMELEFLGSGGTLISGSKLKSLTFNNPLIVRGNYKKYILPEEGRQYAVVVDCSEGLGQDFSVASIFDVTEIPFKQCAIYRDNTSDPFTLPNIVYSLAKEYNEAMILVERNSVGGKVADSIFYDIEYENILMCTLKGQKGQVISTGFGKESYIGVKTTKTVKAQGCSYLKYMLENDQIKINDFDTVQELSTFVRTGSSYEAEQGKHDDIVMTLVLFAWLGNQQYFKELTDVDVRKTMEIRYNQMIEDDLIPFGFFNDHLDEDTEALV